MKKTPFGKNLKHKHSHEFHAPQRRNNNLFTPGFFRFLLAFTLIIGLSFGLLIFLGLKNA